MTIKIALINASTVLSDQQVQAVRPSLELQANRDLRQWWGTDQIQLEFVARDSQPSPGTWWLTVLDNSDQAGALGYHDLTSEGLPLGKVFAGTDKQYGLNWTVTASHELLEMLVDPDINLTVFVQPDESSGTLFAYEACDAVEDDKYAYDINGVKVSNFVTPSWFESFRKPGSTQFDFKNVTEKPFELAAGGYIGYYNVSSGSGWQQKESAQAAARYRSRPHLGSRREQRRTPRDQWRISSVHSMAK